MEVYLDANIESGGHVGAEQDRTRSLLADLYGNLDQQKHGKLYMQCFDKVPGSLSNCKKILLLEQFYRL